MIGQQPDQMAAARRPARISVVVGQAASGECFIDLRIQIVSVGQDQKCEIAAELPADFPGEKDHGIAFARALGVPEHAPSRPSRRLRFLTASTARLTPRN